jgi:hypothetical protein
MYGSWAICVAKGFFPVVTTQVYVMGFVVTAIQNPFASHTASA